MPLTDDAAPQADGLWLRVLASGSAGNCSVLLFRRGGVRRICLMDLGLSPRRTVRLLAELGLGLHDVDDVLLTHLDSDHFYPSWAGMLPRHVRVRLHDRHLSGAARAGMPGALLAPFEGEFTIQHDLGGAMVRPMLTAHDRLGSVAYRIDFVMENRCAALGFATDLGRVHDRLVEHLRGVDTLAIESNYCPRMQLASDRPEVLKQRIMGGAGHLSNHESARAVQDIAPRSRAVLLHLSRQCNTPEAAAAAHAHAACGIVVTSQHASTPWLGVEPAPIDEIKVRVVAGQPGLFDGALAS